MVPAMGTISQNISHQPTILKMIGAGKALKRAIQKGPDHFSGDLLDVLNRIGIDRSIL